jgi:hypothetical protein
MTPAQPAPHVNPYNCSAPGRSFVGYEALREEVLRGFLNEKSYALLGGRRCGKTSLLMRLREDLQQGGLAPFRVLPRFLDMQSLVPRSPFDFFSRVYALVAEGLGAPAWDSPPPRQTYQEFLKRLDDLRLLMERAHGERWLAILLMDELDAAPRHLPDSECFENLRNLLMESRFKAYFRVVASGCSEMGKLIGSGSPLNNLAKIYTRVLTPAETGELVAKGFPEGLSQETEEELLRHTGRHPYALQGLLETLHEAPRPTTPQAVESASERFARDHGSEFQVWHDDVGDSGRACYAELAQREPEGLTQKQLRERVARGHSVSDGLLALSYHGLIHEEPSGQKRIAGTLFKDWFLDHASEAGAKLPPVPPPPPSAPQRIEFPLPLMEACRAKKLALCVGSGLSLSLGVQGGFPTWKQLPQRFIAACERYGTANANFIQATKSLFEHDMPLEVMLAQLGALRASLGRSYQNALNDIFRPDTLSPGPVHHAMARLGVRAFLTTNYDPLIEELRETPRRNVYTWKESSQALTDLKSGRRVLLKIHGTAERAETVVMTELEYHQARSDRSYQAVLSHLLQEYTFLFLGYGMNDPLDLDLIMKWNTEVFNSAAPRHYVMLKDPRGEDRDRYLREYNVQVISYDAYERLPDILDELPR